MTYKNCTEAFKDGVADIPRGTPSYEPKLDRDNDGFGCDRSEAPQGFVPRQAAPVPQKKSPVVTKTQTSVAQPQATLPVTGTGTTYGAIAFALMSIGVICLLAVKRRRISWRSE